MSDLLTLVLVAGLLPSALGETPGGDQSLPAQVVATATETDAVVVPPDLRRAHDYLLRLVDGLGRSARVAYERVGDVVRFRVEVVALTGLPTTSVAEGELAVDVDGLVRFRIDGGAGYQRHRNFRRRAARMRLGNHEIEVLLDAEEPRFPRASRDAIGAALPLEVLRSVGDGPSVVESVAFEGRRGVAPASGADDDLVAAWQLGVRVGRGAGARRYAVTVDPFEGSIIAIERR